MNILICGFGNIGRHVYEEFNGRNTIYIYDKYKNDYKETDLTREYDAAFICVPTEMREDGTVNTDEFFDIVEKVNAKIIIDKSTVPVGTCGKVNKPIVMAPEYYGTTQHSLDMPPFAVIGSDNAEYRDLAVEVYQTVKSGDYKFCFVSLKEAEMAKYVANSWLALKVTFCNEIATLAEKFGIDYNQVRQAWLMDTRVNPSHTFVYKDHPYFDSHCFNKDIPGIITQAKAIGGEMPLLEKALEIRDSKKVNFEVYLNGYLCNNKLCS